MKIRMGDGGKRKPSSISPQIKIAMKLMVVFLTVGLFQASAKGKAQKITYSAQNVPIEKVFSVIKKQTGYVFFYRNDQIAASKPVSVSLKEASIETALEAVFRGQPLDYSIKANTVIISARPVPMETGMVTSLLVTPESTPAFVVSGRVTNEEGIGLAGASVEISGGPRGVTRGTTTDAAGRYVFHNVNEGDVMVFSMVGYLPQRVTVGSQRVINIQLKVDVKQQTEIVVIGYGTSKKKDLTGSVAMVDPKDIEDVPFTTVDNAIAGKAAGVQVTKSDGTPGGAVRIRVRGSSSLLGGNDPLYVIDGVPVQVQSNFINPGFDVSSPVGNNVTGAGGVSAGMSTAFVNGLNSIGGLNIDDIETITILKDASSTAIYGSKAANGVVIITTKKGRKDMKPLITVSYYSTVTKPIYPSVLNGDQYRMLLSEAAKNDYDARQAVGRPISAELNAIVNSPDTYFGKANTNWLDLVTRTTYSHNAEISVQGGGAASRYYSSVSFNTTPGVVLSTNYQRVTGKLSLENEIGKRFRFVTNMNLGYVNQDISNGAYGQALRARPDYTPYDSAGNFTSFDKVAASYEGFQNPMAQLTATNNSRSFSLLGSSSGIYDFSPSLEFKSTASLNMQNYSQRNYTPSYLSIGSFYGNVANNGGIGGNSNSQLTNWFIENTLTYNKTFNENHALNVLVGTSYETRKTSFFSALATGYPNDDILNSLSSAVTPLFTKGDNPSKPQSYLVSYYVRANYSLKDKYLFTFTGRADGSSKFGPENKFGYFPSGAVAWRISQESFLKNVKWINDIKLRGSYGFTGTQNINDQMYRTLYTPYSYAGSSALVPTQLGNPSVKWETTEEYDAGLDFAFFDNRLEGTLDYYKKQTDGALLSLPVAPSSSYSSLLNNVVNLRNTGFEVSLRGDIIRTRNFKWNASVNLTWNKSLVTKLSADADLGQIGDLTGLEYENTTIVEGKPLGIITGMKVTGIIKTEQELNDYKAQLGGYAVIFPLLNIGDPMFKLGDSNDFGRYISFGEVLGNAAPKYYGGFTQGFSYKNFDLNFYFTLSQGGKLFWGDHVSAMRFVGSSNASTVMLNRYNPENTSSNQPRLLFNDQIIYNTNLSLFDASYIKLRTLTFNYRFSRTSNWMQKAGIHDASVYLSANNLFTITSYPGNDPETSDDPYSVGGGYFDVSNYPSVRSLSIGFKAGF